MATVVATSTRLKQLTGRGRNIGGWKGQWAEQQHCFAVELERFPARHDHRAVGSNLAAVSDEASHFDWQAIGPIVVMINHNALTESGSSGLG